MHAIARAKERYDLDLTVEDLAALAAQCRQTCTMLADFGHSRMHLVEHRGIVLKAVYKPDTGIIKTFIAKDQTTKNMKRPPGKKPRNSKRKKGRRLYGGGRMKP